MAMACDDETTALLPSNTAADSLERSLSKDTDPDLVDFCASHDPDNPLDFGRSYKWTVTSLLALMAFTTTFTCVGVVPVADRIIRDLNPNHKSDKSASVLLVTIWELGEAAGPLLIGPLSEIYGRYAVVNIANLGFVGATILAALCQNSKLLIAARALNGLSVASNVLSPSIVGDIFVTEQRGSAMSIVMLAPMLGGAVGPAIAGALAETFGWRAILWLSTLLMSVCCLMFLLIFRETYKVVILRRRAANLRATTGNPRLYTAYDADTTTLGASILRPFAVFFYSPVLIAITLSVSTTFTFFYILSTTLPTLLMEIYHLTPAQTGSSFMLFSLGSLLGVILCNLTLDRIYIYLRDRASSKHSQTTTTSNPLPSTSQPEHRLPLTIVGAIFLPLTIFLYGLIPSPPLSLAPHPFPLIALLTNLAFLAFFLLLSFLPVLSYIVDATGRFSASAMTATIVVRCLFGTFGPLAVNPLVRRYGWFASMAGLAAGVLGMGVVPALILWKGAVWRRGSRYMDADVVQPKKPRAGV